MTPEEKRAYDRKYRALLCMSCNLGIGHLKDDTRILKSAVRYLVRYQVEATDAV